VRRWVPALLFVATCIVVGLCLGPSDVGPSEVWRYFTGGALEPHLADIVGHRVPRVALGCLVGAALSIAGVLFQALLRNDLAEPYLLGVAPGALLGVTVAAIVAGAEGAGTMPPALVRTAFAFAGAIGVAAIVFSFARRSGRMVASTVLLAGVAVGAFVAAIATGALHSAVRDWHLVVRWLLGDLSLKTFFDVGLLGVIVAVGGLVAFVRARDLDVLTLGEDAAWLSGVRVRRALWLLGGVGCLLAAAAVALCGLVGFVGLGVPHLARRLFGPGHRSLIPASALLGAGLLVIADALSRTVHPPSGFPLGVVTAALGAPVLAFLLLRRVG